MDTLELSDIQGYIIRGYANMQYSRYVYLHITQAEQAKVFLNKITDNITHGEHIADKQKLPSTNLNIAFTVTGLKALQLYDENIASFSPEFREPMYDAHRRRLLGDTGTSAPENWVWGGPNTQAIHVLLLVFGKDKETCQQYYESLKQEYINSGITEVLFIDGQTLPENKEHFGFRDGISQPAIAGSGRPAPANNTIKPGEFIFGYKNEYDVLPDAPVIKKEQGNLNLLQATNNGLKDIGKNGSYLVVRQMQQHVHAFWNYMNEKTKNEDGSLNETESIKLASKMVGRWPSGAPLVKFPNADPQTISNDDDFGYHDADSDGAKCPFGSHLRRCNPRDSFEDNGKAQSLKLSNRHRIIRRARLYGEPVIGNPQVQETGQEVGLLFNCFNADISRQFEFIQYTWANSPKVKNLYNDPDPIIGTQEKPDHNQPQNFTVQGCPINKTVNNLQPFVTIKGGAYFFFPSITAIRYLATI
jgi:Dyp-type peroxidase family